MLSFEQAEQALTTIADELPPEIYKHLNGGVFLLPDCKLHPQSQSAPLYIEGEYHYQPNGMGRYIAIYYGSLQHTQAHMPDESMLRRLKEVLYHELTHHLENLCGERALEREDARHMRSYLQQFRDS